ncbi:hypothetical protein I3271_05350 [Photobacterium leiognathi]|uniref:hypothetical protein n=1 Tax=Photobacterium leiognathi TaxID=553611 RepID=UPI001EE00A82|nr:hypothetical protein [Photobacterium leiognathi]MCG3884106.1 hypothetical protein [Photobacterium leiognathi]
MATLFGAGAKLAKPFYVGVSDKKAVTAEEETTEQAFFESIEDDQMLEAMEQSAQVQLRSDAAAAVISWVDDGDAESAAIDSLAYGLAGGEGEELTDEQDKEYAKIYGLMTDFAMQMGATEKDCQAMVDGDDAAADRVFSVIEAQLENNDEAELIANFAHREKLMLEAKKKVIRDGKVVIINTNRRKRIMSAAQKAALKKARLKAHSAAGKAARKKAMRMRKARGL